MIIFSDIIDDVKAAIGGCDDDLAVLKLNDAIELLQNRTHWGPMIGAMDICATECDITLPDDVDSPLAINVGGSPADFRNKWFEFHLNGPGTQCCGQTIMRSWTDLGTFPTFRDIPKNQPSRVIAVPDDDEGNDKSIIIYGYDDKGKWVMTDQCGDGKLQDGELIPIIHGVGIATGSETKFSIITRISKPVTNSFVKIIALDMDSDNGILIGYLRPRETNPSYRRIRVQGPGFNACGNWPQCYRWVRMKFRIKQYRIAHLNDAILLNSRQAIIRGVQAVIKFDKDLPEEGEKYLQMALQFLRDREKVESGPNVFKMQFQSRGFASQGLGNL